MSGFRGSRQYQDGPPAWTHLGAFGGARDKWFKDFWPSQLRPLLLPLGLESHADLKGDNRGLLLTTESQMHARRGDALGFVRDMLGLRETTGWRSGPPRFLSQLVEDFYKEDGQAIAWVTFEAGRDPIGRRHRGYKEVLMPSTTPEFKVAANSIVGRGKIPLIKGIKLTTDDLDMMPPEGLTVRDTHFTGLAVRRTLAVESLPSPLNGNWMSWCLASRDGDAEALGRGSAPASGQHLLAGSINPARLMTWMKLDLQKGNTYSWAFDIHRRTGQIFSIRYAEVPLRMQIELDPWLDDWLLTAIRSF